MIYVNGRNLGIHTTGVQRYTKEIVNQWINYKHDVSIQQPVQPLHGINGHVWEQFLLPCKLRNGMLWSPSNTGPLCVKHQVLTIHDTVPFDHPEWLNAKFVAWYKFLQPKLVARVDKIITISDFSKERICYHLKVPEHKVSVIYNGVDIPPPIIMVDTKKLTVPFDKYVLSVGSLEPRKNIPQLIRAWKCIKNKFDSNIGLVVVGAKGLSRIFVDSGIDLSCSDSGIYFTGHVTDADLVSLYQNAIGFCYPSIYEGFGLPPLEAMSYGTPVLTSNTTAMKELCKGKAILVDPLSMDSIADGLLELITANNMSNTFDNQLYAKSFTWEKCANKTWSVIND